MTELSTNAREYFGASQLFDGPDDLLTKRQQAVALKGCQVVPQDSSKRIRQRGRFEQFVLDHVDTLQEVSNGGEKSIATCRIKLTDAQTVGFTAEKCRELIVV